MTGRRVITAIVVIVATIVVLGGLLVWKPPIDSIEAPKATAFNSALVVKGAELADHRQLCSLSHRTWWQDLCRVPCAADAFRHHLFEQYYTGCRNRDWQLVGRSIPPCPARRRRPQRAPSLSGISLRPFYSSYRRRYPRALCVHDHPRSGAFGAAGKQITIPFQHSSFARGLEAAVPGPPPTRWRCSAKRGME